MKNRHLKVTSESSSLEKKKNDTASSNKIKAKYSSSSEEERLTPDSAKQPKSIQANHIKARIVLWLVVIFSLAMRIADTRELIKQINEQSRCASSHDLGTIPIPSPSDQERLFCSKEPITILQPAGRICCPLDAEYRALQLSTTNKEFLILVFQGNSI